MKITFKLETIIEAVGLAVAVASGPGLSRKINRIAQALESQAAATGRLADAAEHPRLPRPSLLSHADLKPIPAPDPEPCSRGDMDERSSCTAAETDMRLWPR